MAAPADDPRFATSATYTVDGDDWGGDANKVAPGVGRIAEGFEPASLPAEWLNWVLNLIGAWLYHFRTLLLDYAAGPAARVSIIAGCEVQALEASWFVDGTESAKANAVGKFGVIPFSRELHTGDSLTGIVVKLLARNTDFSVKVYRFNHTTGATTQMGSTGHPATTGSIDSVTISFTAHTVDRANYSYYVQVTSSSSAGGGGSMETLDSVYVQYNQAVPH